MNWAWITGRIITATGWTFQILNEQSACDIVELLEYWKEEPPTHVLLALRYLGPNKPAKLSEEQARAQMDELSQISGRGAQPLPDYLRSMIQMAEEFNEKHSKTTKK